MKTAFSVRDTIKQIIKASPLFNLVIAGRIAKAKIRKLLCRIAVPSLSKPKDGYPQFIITLTSYRNRVADTAPYTVCSLLRQTVKPDRIILWLAHGTAVPPVLERLTRKGLEIKFCDDIRSYTKLVPALLEFPDDVLITADDDTWYRRRWFEMLKTAYLKEPEKIHCHRANILLDNNHNIMPYNSWPFVKTAGNAENIFPTGVGGILYPPHSLDEHCTEAPEFLNIAPENDDIWFWAMAKLKGTKYSIVNNCHIKLIPVDPQEKGLWEKNHIGRADKQLKAVLERFPALLGKDSLR